MPREDAMHADTLDDLLARVERVWEASHDIDEIHRLAATMPAHIAEVYEFLELLISLNSAMPEPINVRTRVDQKVRRYLEQQGFADAAAAQLESAPTTPTTIIQALKSATGMDVTALAAAIEVSPSFLLGLQGRLGQLPLRACQEISRRAACLTDLPSQTFFALLDAAGSFPTTRSARRMVSEPVPADKGTYQSFIEGVGLTPEQVEFWLSLRGDS